MADARELDIRMDASTLYREEIYTDRRVGTIRVLVPVTAMGATDPARALIYTGEAQIMTQVGALPVSFDIEANTLADAVEGYAEAAKAAVERTIKELQDLRRQAASGLVLPGQGGIPPNFNPGGGRVGGGKIQMP